MKASIYDWEMLYITPDQSFDLCVDMLRKKKWEIVMVGSEYSFFVAGDEKMYWGVEEAVANVFGNTLVGLRKFDSMIPFFERVVNAVHKELPEAKFAFNTSIEKTRDAVDRVAASKE